MSQELIQISWYKFISLDSTLKWLFLCETKGRFFYLEIVESFCIFWKLRTKNVVNFIPYLWAPCITKLAPRTGFGEQSIQNKSYWYRPQIVLLDAINSSPVISNFHVFSNLVSRIFLKMHTIKRYHLWHRLELFLKILTKHKFERHRKVLTEEQSFFADFWIYIRSKFNS